MTAFESISRSPARVRVAGESRDGPADNAVSVRPGCSTLGDWPPALISLQRCGLAIS